MAVTRSGKTIILTAAGDTVAAFLAIAMIRFRGTGLTAGQQLIIKEGSSAGPQRINHYVAGANEDVELFEGQGDGDEVWLRGIYLDTVPAAGTFSVTVHLK